MTEEKKETNIYEALDEVRSKLKVPKDKFNEHGKFKYRDLETILREAKPLCAATKTILFFEEKIETIGDRFYVIATVFFRSMANPTFCVAATGYAREADQQKGMNSAQLTGSTSSYARKSACNNLFLLDDAKDADSYKVVTISDEQATKIQAKLDEADRNLEKFLEYFQIELIADMSVDQYNTAIKILDAKPKEEK